METMMTRALLSAFLALAALAAVAGHGGAQDYPARPVKFLVPYPPGGGNDILARALSEKLSERTGQRFFVENVGGAGGNVGTGMAARAEPDGYTILMANNAFVINPSLYKSLPFDVRRDFAPSAMVSSIPMLVVVHPSVQARSIQELAELARRDPNGMTYATPGAGTPQHLATELFASKLGLKLRHVPYRGTGPAVQDTLAGHVKLMFATAASVEQHVATGALRVLGVTTAARSSSFPDVPTVAEAGVADYDASLWYGILVPAKTPAAVNERLSAQIMAIAREPEFQARLKALGFETNVLDQAAFARVIASDHARWEAVVRGIGLTAD
jgi:tripartite-type tricarboxylate transporter receptor subunit TctC